jgi:hypothetical protein
MEKAFVRLLTATNSDSRRIQELADIVASDPGFLRDYEEKVRHRERVRLNQQVGASIEKIFRTVFGASDVTDLGLWLERTGWGSDFCIEHNLLDESGEVAFELSAEHGKRVFIELKSTFGAAVSMSEKQGTKLPQPVPYTDN